MERKLGDLETTKIVFMATWVVKIKGWTPGKYVGVTTIKGKEHYIVSWDKFNDPYAKLRGKPLYTVEVPKELCTLVRIPGKFEKKVRKFFKRLFEMRKVRIVIGLILVVVMILILFITTSCKTDPDKMNKINPNSMWGPYLDSGRIVLKESVVIRGYIFMIVEVDGREFFCPPEGGLVELTKR